MTMHAIAHANPRSSDEGRHPPLSLASASPIEDLAPADSVDRPLSEVDPEMAEVLKLELERQQDTLDMCASENFAPAAVLECQGSVLTNKYAVGYPGRREYGGCVHVDVSEQLAIERACELFGAAHANVQPYSGALANTAAYHALLDPGDGIIGLDVEHGGHLTHGKESPRLGPLVRQRFLPGEPPHGLDRSGRGCAART